MATVGNIDWPSKPGLPTYAQQAELVELLDRAARLHLNAVIFQVRPAADALYASELEPWSEYLTGQMGQAPEPFWDPLAFAVEESHKRGLELHAWVNPYRAKSPEGHSPPSRNHVSRAHPEWVREYGRGQLWMDPGEPAVREHTVRVVLDIVKRYDVDGLHIDDYFYPYREGDGRGRVLDFPDARSYARYVDDGGTLARDDWRRANVNQLVEALATGIRKTKPWVKFGISPFGIWRPNNPSSVRGLDAYVELFADSRLWVRKGWGDYFAPQLYWRVASPQQNYADLLEWWIEQNPLNRHMWPGNYTSRVGSVEGGQNWAPAELLEQIRLTRNGGAGGNVHFSMRVFDRNPRGLDEALVAGPYAAPALVPASPWMMPGGPAQPAARLARDPVTGGLTVTLPAAKAGAATAASKAKPAPWQYLVQAQFGDSAWTTAIVPATQSRVTVSSGPTAPSPRAVVVTPIDRVGNEGTRIVLGRVPPVPAAALPPSVTIPTLVMPDSLPPTIARPVAPP